MKPTQTDKKLRTYLNGEGPFDIGMEYNPWRSPGFAKMIDSCGVAGGEEPGASIHGFKYGYRGSDLPVNLGPTWSAGSTQEVSFSLYANHGGKTNFSIRPQIHLFAFIPIRWIHVSHVQAGQQCEWADTI
jgi:hypothetical protein